ncbi:hypothetical protein Hypma_014809 [Hypsizygus marmoreus]|uniref:Uncharacterized protein n=1 Tax=Hypsizygus marmoreus TaxID=39966 RepID=A0A369KD62_HYPMA|nr:hypothetical protein Hypma_014809 [Hypsizygus marmoreus]
MERWHTGYCKVRLLSHCSRQVASSPPSQQVEDFRRVYGLVLLGVAVIAFASPFPSPLVLEARIDRGRALAPPWTLPVPAHSLAACRSATLKQGNPIAVHLLSYDYLKCTSPEIATRPRTIVRFLHWNIVDRPCNSGPTWLTWDVVLHVQLYCGAMGRTLPLMQSPTPSRDRACPNMTIKRSLCLAQFIL